MNQVNEVIGPYRAMVDGKSTALAGCSDAAGCDKAAFCLRSNERLLHRARHRNVDGDCCYLIPVKAVSA